MVGKTARAVLREEEVVKGIGIPGAIGVKRADWGTNVVNAWVVSGWGVSVRFGVEMLPARSSRWSCIWPSGIDLGCRKLTRLGKRSAMSSCDSSSGILSQNAVVKVMCTLSRLLRDLFWIAP